MAANLDGIIFDQFYGDNTGGAEFDTDGDGTATQEDEFVSVSNTSGVPVDLSGWQIWSDMSGSGAPDGPQDGLFHTFPPGTVLNPGKTLYIVNEITGTPANNMQEASEGGVESGAGGINTNFLTEGDGNSLQPESVALVNPATGDYIILNFSASEPSGIPGLSGFPGTTSVGESNAVADTGIEDQNAGSSYKYNPITGTYDYAAVLVTCYAAGTLIDTPTGLQAVEILRPADLVLTVDCGPQPIRWIRKGDQPLEDVGDDDQPVLIKANALGAGRPARGLIVSPQHRILVGGGGQLIPYFKTEAFAAAKALTTLQGIGHMKGQSKITWVHFALDRHAVVTANGCLSESLLLGPMVLNGLTRHEREQLAGLYGRAATPDAALNGPAARGCLKVGEVRRHLARCRAAKGRQWDNGPAAKQWGTETIKASRRQNPAFTPVS